MDTKHNNECEMHEKYRFRNISLNVKLLGRYSLNLKIYAILATVQLLFSINVKISDFKNKSLLQ